MVGDPAAIIAAAPEGRDLADSIGDEFNARRCRSCLGVLDLYRGEMTRAVAQQRELAAEAKAAHDPFNWVTAVVNEVFVLAWMGDVDGAQAAADTVVEQRALLGEFIDRTVYSAIGLIRLAEGDATAARDAYEVALQRTPHTRATAISYGPAPLAPLGCGDVTTARLWADGVVAVAEGVSLVGALTCRARVALAEGEVERAGDDAREALGLAVDLHGYVVTVPDGIECLAYVAGEAGSDRESARLFGAAHAARRQASVPRLKTLDADHERRLAAVRDSLG
jgi:hypothetical protein